MRNFLFGKTAIRNTMKFTTLFCFGLSVAMTVACRSSDQHSERCAGTESPLVSNDISNQQIKAIAEDAQGHIWLGTFRGLNKYNAHEYQQYFCTDDSLSLPDNQIQDLMLDSKKRLWIATVNGPCLYTDQDDFRRLPMFSDNRNVLQFFEDRAGRVFMSTRDELYEYNDSAGGFDRLLSDLDRPNTFHTRCHVDSDNRLWIFNSMQLRCYDPESRQVVDSIALQDYPLYSYLHKGRYLYLTGNFRCRIFDTRTGRFDELPEVMRRHPLFARADVEYIHPYDDDRLLFNTAKHGMFCYDFVRGTFIHQQQTGFPFEVPAFKIRRMFTDSQRNLWIGSEDQGYTVRYHYKNYFNSDNYLRSSLSNKSVVSVVPDNESRLWIATLMDGLWIYDLPRQRLDAIGMDELFPQEKQRKMHINRLFVDRDGAVWLTANNHNVLKCRYRHGSLQVLARHNVFLPMSIAQDREGTIWVGTATHYLHALAPGSSRFEPVQAFDGTFSFTPDMLSLSDGSLLVSAFGQPLKRIVGRKIEKLAISDDDFRSCIPRSVFVPTALLEDSGGDIWIGTIGNGLIRYVPSENKVHSMSGTTCLDISALGEDSDGNLWISTQYGLNKYDRQSGRFTAYYASDGLGGNQFYERASCRLPDGTLIFGGTHGLTLFDPHTVPAKRRIPLVFENLRIHNRLVAPRSGGPIDRHLSYNPEIRLRHDQNGFSISFAALEYSEYGRVHYHYKLDGFDDYWIEARNNHEANYANLPAGRYTLRVKISSNDQSIAETENAIPIIVAPAPWHTWWAYTCYVAVVTGLVWLLVLGWRRIQAGKAAVRIAEREKAQERRMNGMIRSFFSNVSHEFRTPLTMISGPVAQLCEDPELSEKNRELLHIVRRSTDRMLELVNQQLDFSELENDTLRLKVRRTDIIGLLKRRIDIFRMNAAAKGIVLQTCGLEEQCIMWLDEDKQDKIFGNLMSNALKFTPANGRIAVRFDMIGRDEAARLFPGDTAVRWTRYVKVSVANTGPTIPEELREKIFERYYRIDNSPEGNYCYGTGIGLYYTRSLVELHHGRIRATSPENHDGAVFTFVLPLDDEAYAEQERSAGKNGEIPPPTHSAVTDVSTVTECSDKPESKSVLVLDDDAEVVHYLRTLLAPYYRVLGCFDAREALQLIDEEAPDLVLSDVVLPGMNGYAFCRRIKEDAQLCHIPVVLVTAKTDVEDKVEGLDTGADAYVTKPFEPSYLLALVKSQLRKSERVRRLLGQSTQTTRIEEDLLAPQDKAFMTELYRLMETELSNPEFDIACATEALRISRTKFFYKIKGLTGESPNVFFKTYKLNRAAELILEGRYTISEIADMTGFSTLSHFSKSFKKQFGLAPSEYHG